MGLAESWVGPLSFLEISQLLAGLGASGYPLSGPGLGQSAGDLCPAALGPPTLPVSWGRYKTGQNPLACVRSSSPRGSAPGKAPWGLREESSMGEGSVLGPASEACRSACRAEEAIEADGWRPRSLGEGHLPKATQSLVVEPGLPLAPFSAHSAC